MPRKRRATRDDKTQSAEDVLKECDPYQRCCEPGPDRMRVVTRAISQTSALGPGCVKARTVMGWADETGWPAQPVSCSDRFHQSANAQNAHHPFHVVGQNVQRHFGAYVLECFHLQVRRSHPG